MQIKSSALKEKVVISVSIWICVEVKAFCSSVHNVAKCEISTPVAECMTVMLFVITSSSWPLLIHNYVLQMTNRFKEPINTHIL